MSHYTIDYSQLSGPEKEAKAVKDCKEYLKGEMWGKFCTIAIGIMADPKQTGRDKVAAFYFITDMVGINGYPVWALRRYFVKMVKEGNHAIS